MRTLALAAVVALLLVAGCGSSHRSQAAAVDAALAQSPRSYLHYTAPIWWGMRPDVHRDSLAFDGQFALAKISAPRSHPGDREQWVLLARNGQRWRVVGNVLGKSTSLPCADGTKHVLKQLAGGCSRRPVEWPGGAIVGPRMERAPNSGETAGLTAAARRAIFGGQDSCVTYLIAISKVDERYARVEYQFHKPYGNCRLGNGESIFRRTSSGWTHLEDASEPFPCASMPAGVARSLLGECWIPAR